MKISVLIHNLNRAEALERCLSSVAELSYRPLEAVILDAGSTDQSMGVIDRMSSLLRRTGIQVRVVPCTPMGVAASRNLAARHASGDLLCFIDNDAAFASVDGLQEVRKLFAGNPNLGLISFKVLKGDSDEADPVTWVFRRPREVWSGTQFATFTFVGTGFCVRADAFQEACGFWEHLIYSREEEDLSFALIDRGLELVYSPAVEIRHYPEPKGRMSLAERRCTELRNGILVLWRRAPLTIAPLAIAGRLCTMALTVKRERNSLRHLIRALPQAIEEWQRSNLRRLPVTIRSTWRYATLFVGASRGRLSP